MPADDPPWFELATTVPLAATEWLGLGPFRQRRSSTPARLRSLALSEGSLSVAIETAGTTGVRILSLLVWHGGVITTQVLAAETHGADPDDLIESIGRLAAAGLVSRGPADALRLPDVVAGRLAPIGVSFADQNAMTSEQLGRVCQVLEIKRPPTRKQERIDAISEHFSNPVTRGRVLESLSDRARALLDEIADVGGPRVIDPISVGLNEYGLHRAESPRFRGGRDRAVPGEVAPVAELTARGIVGLDAWNDGLWIWREAWPLLDRPLFRQWPSVPVPATGRLTRRGLRLPPLVGLVERALHHWDEVPPAVLKSGDRRVAKGVLRSTAAALGTEEATVEVIAAMALSMGLLLPNVVKTSGRGRNRTVEQVWLSDPEMRSAWSGASAPTRWLRIVSEWTSPGVSGSEQLVANRHLLLWELGGLDEGVGWVDDAEVGRWMQHRYGPIAVDDAVVESLRDLRALGLVTTDGPVGLSPLGALALDDPTAVERADFGSADRAIVQADETIVCPPDLDADLMVRIGQLARLESDAGAPVFRLDETLITKAVQRGDSPAAIVAFLEALSSVPLPDTVRTLVADSAGRAERVRVVEATTVVVTVDPVDLATACRLKAAKLTAVSDTVAVSPLPAEKVRRALDRKGLAPVVITVNGEGFTPRKSSDDAAPLERAARRQREMAERHNLDGPARHAELLERQAAAARSPASKLAVSGPLALTPKLLERVRA